jgi:dolichol-phosphate mannosyltransferase
LKQIPPQIETIYVVDDCCPEESGALVEREVRDPRVHIIRHQINQGVGGAVVSGILAALEDGSDIVVKIDGDGQMDPSLLPFFVTPIANGTVDVAKGNRFYNPEDVRAMPASRLLGNAVLSFMTKLSSGYWNIFDPTNGYIAWDTRVLANLRLDKLEKRFLFESDLLFRLGLLRAKVLDVPMIAIYGDEKSNLRAIRQVLPLLRLNSVNFIKRIIYNYYLRDFNVASLEIFFGLLASLFGIVYGITHWGQHAPASAGTVMIAALPLLTGIILLISFVNFDTQQVPREPISSRLPRYREMLNRSRRPS